MNWFLLIAVAVCALFLGFLGFRVTGIGIYSWLVAGVSIGILLFYPLVWYAVLPDTLDRFVRAILHFDIGLLSLLITFLVLRDVLFLPLMIIKPDWAHMAFSLYGTVLIGIVCVALLGIGFWNARQGPQLVKASIPISGLSSELENFSIVQISDLHTGPGISADYVANVVEKAMSTKADLIVLTGDIADGSFEKYQHQVDPLSMLARHTQVLYVVGNHEYIRDSEKWLHYFRKMGIQVLLNEYTIIKKGKSSLLVAGVIDPSVKEIDPTSGPDIRQALAGSPVADVRILLAHQPSIAKEASPHFDLQLSGHTHAGQFFPWNLAIKIFQPYSTGLNKCDRMWVYTNAGNGYWGPPFRLGTRSEITLLSLTKQGL